MSVPKTVQAPKYLVGAKIGSLEVLEVGPWSKVSPDGKMTQRGQWHFYCECGCGSREWFSARQLRERMQCLECVKDVRVERLRKGRDKRWKVEELPPFPDPFLTLR